VWQQETRTAYTPADLGGTGSARLGAISGTPLIGVHDGLAVHLLLNGILGDRRPDSENILKQARRDRKCSRCHQSSPLGESVKKFKGQIFPPMALINVPNAANQGPKLLFSKEFFSVNCFSPPIATANGGSYASARGYGLRI